MIGRKQRKRVVFIDGIPIESAILDAGAPAAEVAETAVNADALKELDPRALFDKYDADGSGGIDFEEFKILLRDLHIVLSEPKALAYFKRCDKMRRGHISFDEFRVALYTCDPKNPNRTMGFSPGQALSPKDLFDMFDKEEQGAIDRGTFLEILEFLGRKMPLDQMEAIFATHEDPEMEMMLYYQFKKVWLGLVDVRAELRNRHEKFNRLATHATLMKKLETLVNLEEKQEAHMLLEAATTLADERVAAYRRWLVEESITLSKLVLSEAIDAAGQVYVFGKGPFGRFDGEPIAPDFVEFMDYEILRDLWKARVRPDEETLSMYKKVMAAKKAEADEDDDVRHESSDDDSASDSSGDAQNPAEDAKDAPAVKPSYENDAQGKISRAKMTLMAAARAFAGRQVSLVPTFLWGKRVSKVALGPAVAYALTDSGEIFCWGGSKRQWRYFYDAATMDASTDGKNQVGTSSLGLSSASPTKGAPPMGRPLTTRTEMLKQAMPAQAEDQKTKHDELYLRKKYQRTFVKPVRPLPTEEEKRRKLELLGLYFDVLPSETPAPKEPPIEPAATKTSEKKGALDVKKEEGKEKKKTKLSMMKGAKAPHSPATPTPETDVLPVAAPPPPPPRKRLTYQVLLETVEPDLNVDDLVVSLELRGVHMAKQTRMELIDKLGDCLLLELECVGEKFHAYMKEQDKAARRAKHDRREKVLQNLLVKGNMVWNELRILQEDIVRIDNEDFTKTEHEYIEMKQRIARAKQKIKRQAREGFFNDDSTGQELLYLNGLTSRGAPQRFFRGDQAVLDISVGSRHALAVHQTGKLFTWGVGTFGRLGGVRHERNSGGNSATPESTSPHSPEADDDIDAWHRDIHEPQQLSALENLRFRSVCCGFGHSLALTTQGDVYVWGSATHGKLGIGAVSANATESFTLRPLQLQLPGKHKAAVRVRKIACGPSHSALLTTEGALFVWGSGDGGKLGLGDGREVGEDRVPRNGGQLRVVEVPTRVDSLIHETCVEVSCGTAHTAVVTAVVAINSESGDERVSGGRLYVAGSNHALGKFTPMFTPLHVARIDGDEADRSNPVVITRVSCGNAHTAIVSHDGELLTWGNNAGGCTGHPISIPLVKIPTRVACLYQYPRNLCLEKGVVALQSSQNASCIAEFALQKCEDPDDAATLPFAQTQQEMCPFWQARLVAMSRIERVVVVFKRAPVSMSSRVSQRSQADAIMVSSSRSQSSSATSRTSRPSSSGTARNAAIKYAVMVSEVPFDVEERGKYSVAQAKGHSIHSSFQFERENDVQFTWTVPVDTYGKYVRVQMENAVGMLSLVSVSVVGTKADEYNGPRVNDVACGEGITVVVCKPLSSIGMVRERFQRAVRADRESLWILEQLETFHPFVLQEVERKAIDSEVKPACVLCKPKERCVICLLDEATFATEIQKELARKRKEREDQQRLQREQEAKRQEEWLREQKNMMRGGGGSSLSVAQTKAREAERRKAAREAKAKAAGAAKANGTTIAPDAVVEDPIQVLKRTLTLEEKCQKLLNMNLRTEEEEEEAEKRLAAELLAIDPLAAAADQTKKQTQATPGLQLVAKVASNGSLLGRLASLFSSKQRSSLVATATTTTNPAT